MRAETSAASSSNADQGRALSSISSVGAGTWCVSSFNAAVCSRQGFCQRATVEVTGPTSQCHAARLDASSVCTQPTLVSRRESEQMHGTGQYDLPLLGLVAVDEEDGATSNSHDDEKRDEAATRRTRHGRRPTGRGGPLERFLGELAWMGVQTTTLSPGLRVDSTLAASLTQTKSLVQHSQVINSPLIQFSRVIL